MRDLVFEGLLHTVPQSTGHAVVYALTFGRVRCEEGVATVVGFVFWLLVFGFVTLIVLRT
jgi:hypothetical protein